MGVKLAQQKGTILVWVLIMVACMSSLALHVWQITFLQVKIYNNHLAFHDSRLSLERKLNETEAQLYENESAVASLSQEKIGFIPDTLVFNEDSGVTVYSLTIELEQSNSNLELEVHERLRMSLFEG